MTAPLTLQISANSSSISHPSSVNPISDTTPASTASNALDQRMFDHIPPANLLKIYKGCSNCRTQKIKCSGQEPCSRCRAFGLQCQYIVLPNQPAHRIALAVSAQEPPLIQIYTSPSALNPSPSRVWQTQTQTPSHPAKKRRSRYNSGSHEDAPHSPSSSRSSPEPEDSPTTPPSGTLPPGSHNILLQSIADAVDPGLLTQKEIPDSVVLDAEADTDLIRRLVALYMRYTHPLFRIVNETDPIFWSRLDGPMTPEVSSLVYAMCTIGAILKSKAPSDGQIDDHVIYFYRKTRSVIESRPKDFTTLQSLLIIQNLHVFTHQKARSEEDYKVMAEIAESIKLGDMVKKTVFHKKLSHEDLALRNTWRMLIWIDTLENMDASKNHIVDPLMELSSPGLDSRAEEIPGTKSTSSEAAYFYIAGLFKIFQYISKIRSPLSPRDLHPVTSALDTLCLWHNSLPKNLRCNTKAGETTTVSTHATNLDLFYRLGHILLLNLLPQSVRSSPTGLGPRRESPLRILATCANGITSAMGELIKHPDLKNYSIIHGMRCLTEAAVIQMHNSKELDPAISTPAKVNFMKTLWCIKQLNFAIPANVLQSILDPVNDLMNQANSAQRTDREGRSRVDEARTRTPSSSAESPTNSNFPSGREYSLASDYTSSSGSTREGSHMTIFESEEIDRERLHNLPTSPTQISAANLMTLSLESPTVTQRGFNFDSNLEIQAAVTRSNLVNPKVEDQNEILSASPISPSSALVSPKLEQSSDDFPIKMETRPDNGVIRENQEFLSDPGLRGPGNTSSVGVERSMSGRRSGPGDQYYKEHDAYSFGANAMEESHSSDIENSYIPRQPLKRSVSQNQIFEDSGARSPKVRDGRGSNYDHSVQGSYHQIRRGLVGSPDANHPQNRLNGRGFDSVPQEYFPVRRQDGKISVVGRAAPQTLRVSMNYKGHHTSPHENSPRTPLSASSDVSLRERFDDTEIDVQELKYPGGRNTFIAHESQLGNRGNTGYPGGYIGNALVEHDKNDSGDSTSQPRILGRKRPSISMYGQEAMYGANRNGKVDGTNDMRDGEGKQFQNAGIIYIDPLHPDGAEAARLRGLRRESYDRQTRPEYGPSHFIGGSFPGQTMMSPTQIGHELHHTSSSSIHHAQQQHAHRTQHQHYSYQRLGSSTSPSHRHNKNHYSQDGQQHEPRTSPRSIAPLSSSSTSHPPDFAVGDSYTASRPVPHTRRYPERPTQRQLQDQHYDQEQYWRQESEVYEHYQRQEIMGHPPVRLERVGNDFGDAPIMGNYSNEDELGAGIVEVLRDPIRRKFR